MTTTKITLETDCGPLGIFLHPPGAAEPILLPGANRTSTQELVPGVYAITVAGSVLTGTKVALTIDAGVNAITRRRKVRSDGTIHAWITFELTTEGEIK